MSKHGDDEDANLVEGYEDLCAEQHEDRWLPSLSKIPEQRLPGTWHSKHPGRGAVAGYPCRPISGLLQYASINLQDERTTFVPRKARQRAKQEESGEQSGRGKR